jgi:membrane associated rhomboid family serine protease
MIPLGDYSRRPSRLPAANVGIITPSALVFVIELANGDEFVTRWSVIPSDVLAGLHLGTIATAMFIHTSWSHILGNMVFLWALGPKIEDAMGRVHCLLSYLIGGTVATPAQMIADPTSTVPCLGASGAIAAVMGAFLVT